MTRGPEFSKESDVSFELKKKSGSENLEQKISTSTENNEGYEELFCCLETE